MMTRGSAKVELCQCRVCICWREGERLRLKLDLWASVVVLWMLGVCLRLPCNSQASECDSTLPFDVAVSHAHVTAPSPCRSDSLMERHALLKRTYRVRGRRRSGEEGYQEAALHYLEWQPTHHSQRQKPCSCRCLANVQ